MTGNTAFRRILSIAFLPLCLCLAAKSAAADRSHARIIRLSYVQGAVRITHSVSGDPLQSADNAWEGATLNLPIHQGDALATDDGRAEVEFESGTVAFLSEHTVLEFYDLSLDNGSFTTRLILRQGSASFSVRPGQGDYFSVTGGDFSIEANEKSYFRLNNYDDGSDAQVFQGHISVLNKGKTTPIWKGQSVSARASDPDSVSVEAAAGSDNFDKWASGRIQSGQAALTASQQYSGGYDYTAGFGDLYTYGGWYSAGGYGYGWRPYGVSFGWNPFSLGHWFFDPAFGNWVFIGGQPWGWLPYHFGNWILQPGLGWVWVPTGAFPYTRGGSFATARNGVWKPVNATWVRSGSGVGLVPTHPLDTKGKTPINLREGVFPVSQGGVSDKVVVSANDNWKSFKNPARELMPAGAVTTSAPVRVVRMMAAGESSAGIVATNHESGIIYNPAEHRFVNGSQAVSTERELSENQASGTASEQLIRHTIEKAKTSDLRRGVETPGGRGSTAGASGSAAPSTRASVMPPAAPPPSSSARTGGGSAAGGGSRSGGSAGGSSSSSSSRTWSGGSSSASSSSASSARSSSSSSSSSSSGGRPH